LDGQRSFFGGSAPDEPAVALAIFLFFPIFYVARVRRVTGG
jgi:hypothetical protein